MPAVSKNVSKNVSELEPENKPRMEPDRENDGETWLDDDRDTAAVSDVWSFLLSQQAYDPTEQPQGARVLEVHQVVGDGVVEMLHFRRGESVSVGSSVIRELRFGGVRLMSLPGSTGIGDACWKHPFFVPASLLPTEDHVLFEARGDGWVARIDPRWAGFVEQEGQRTPISALCADMAPDADGLLRLPVSGRMVLDLGGPAFIAQAVSPGRKTAPPPIFELDTPMAASLMFMAAVATLVGTAVWVAPPPIDPGQNLLDDPKVVVMLQQQETPKPEPAKPAAEGAKPKGAEGKAGKREPGPVERSMEKRRLDRAIAEDAGLIAALRDDAALDAVLSDASLSANLTSGVGGLIGNRSTSVGVNGLSGRGGGVGGGGTADQIGGMGTHGRGGGTPGGYGKLSGDDGPKAEGTIGMRSDEVILLGQMDKALIDAVIKRNLASIKHCYQRELVKNPSIAGRITVKFIIAKDGSVSSAVTKSSSMGSPAVEACINSRIMQFQFPTPKAGGMVAVSYPFIFAQN